MKNLNITFIIAIILLQSCKNNETVPDETPQLPSVSVVNPAFGNLSENEQINGQVVFIDKTNITAPISGYVNNVSVKLGDLITKGTRMFSIQTKESQALENAKVATPNQFGIIPVYATASGIINQLDITNSGVFITEGNAMATIVKSTDLVIQVNAPFQYSKILKNTKTIEVELPNQEVKIATLYKTMPTVDPVSQTQQFFFKLTNFEPLPENLNVIIRIPVKQKSNVITVPKDAVLTNETQDEFWIMKVTKDNLAIKTAVTKGLETDSSIEIVSPILKPTDVIIKNGAYGLTDSTQVKIN